MKDMQQRNEIQDSKLRDLDCKIFSIECLKDLDQDAAEEVTTTTQLN